MVKGNMVITHPQKRLIPGSTKMPHNLASE